MVFIVLVGMVCVSVVITLWQTTRPGYMATRGQDDVAGGQSRRSEFLIGVGIWTFAQLVVIGIPAWFLLADEKDLW